MEKMTVVNQRQHYYWIDWMKFIGMYFIVAGHFFPAGHEYLYVFSVPLFFITSGFLAKNEGNEVFFWKKILHNLLLPCIVICIIMFLIDIAKLLFLGRFEWKIIPKWGLNCIMGFQGENTYAGGLKLCWFIYTLILCKVINQYTAKWKYLRGSIVLLCLLVALWYNNKNYHLYNSIINTSLAYPLFVAGGGGKIFYISYGNMMESVNHGWRIFLIIACVVIVFVIGWQNGAPWMYDNRYGENLLLFFIGAVAGTVSVFIVSYYLQNIHFYVISIISQGSIIILGFQKLFIRLFKHLPSFYDDDLLKYIYAFVIMILFIPIIQLSEKYCPILLGFRMKRR